MGLFDLFRQKGDKVIHCARCKSEITEDESEWIGNHRFCKACAKPPKVFTGSRGSKEHAVTDRPKVDLLRCTGTLSAEDLMYHQEEKQEKLEKIICKGDILETLKYILYLSKKETLTGINEYEHTLKKQLEELERKHRMNDEDVKIKEMWFLANAIYSQLARQYNLTPYTSPFKIDSYISLERKDIEHSPKFHFSGYSHFDIISIGLVKSGKFANQLFIEMFTDGYPSGVCGGFIEVLPENYRSYNGVKNYCYGRGFVIASDIITEETYNDRIKQLYCTCSLSTKESIRSQQEEQEN